MRTTIDASGRLVDPRALRARVGLSVPAAVDVVVDGSAIRIEPVVGDGLVEQDGILVIPSTGAPITNEMILELRDADRRWPRERSGTRQGIETDEEREEVLLDSSAAIPLVLADHEFHGPVLRATSGRRRGLAGHAWFETYSVLTRLPAGLRQSPEAAREALCAGLPRLPVPRGGCSHRPSMGAGASRDLGGAVFDALVAAVARAHDLPLYSCDRRAERTIGSIGADARFVVAGS